MVNRHRTSPTDSAAPFAALRALQRNDINITSLTKGVWLRSLTGLVLIAILATTTFFLLHDVLSINQRSATVVNISGLQRMLSQRGALFSLKLVTTTDSTERQELHGKLKEVADLMLKSHEGLTKGSKELGLPDKLSADMKRLYFDPPDELDKQVRQYIEHINQLLADVDKDAATYDNEHLQYILKVAPAQLLKTLNAAVLQYEKEAAAEVQRAILYEKIVYAVTLLTLLLEALLIYRPLVNRVKSTTEKLVRQQQFSDRVVDTSQALIIGLNSSGLVLLFNQYGQRLSGYSENEVVGYDFMATFIPPDERQALAQVYADLFMGKASSRLETPFLTKDGRKLTIEWSNALLSDPISKKPLLLLATGLDITQRKQAAQDLQMALDETAALSSRLQQEVAHAALLQRAMLPAPDINLPGLHGLAKLTTSTEVGGDYYDYYAVDGYHSVFFIGDVSGHGVASGTLVSAAKMAVHQLANQGETDPAAMLEHLNEALLTASHDNMFMTMLCCSLDSRTGRLRLANAGHSFPYLWMASEQAWGMIEVEGVPLGRVTEPKYVAISLDLAEQDRLFLYTDGLVEEENTQKEPFGYERVEELLYEIATLPLDTARDHLFTALKQHCQRETFSDDVTILFLEHHERVIHTAPVPIRRLDTREIIQLDALTFLEQPSIPEHLSRQHIVVSYETGQIADLIVPLCQAGIRRVLPSDQVFLRELGWQTLLQQHHLFAGDDIYQWFTAPTLQREWVLTHSDEKSFIMQEIVALLADTEQVSHEMQDIVLLMSDELIENSLYGAPLDEWQQKFYHKGQSRIVDPAEGIRVTLLQDADRLGLMVTDHWGTFTPVTFLHRLMLNAAQQGIEAGVGGAGMYLMWRMCDYLQIRVMPQQQTQVTLLWSLHDLPDDERDSGFQFLYHHELNELLPDHLEPDTHNHATEAAA